MAGVYILHLGVGNMAERAAGERKGKFMNTICTKTRTKWSKCVYFYTTANICKGEKIWSPKGGVKIFLFSM